MAKVAMSEPAFGSLVACVRLNNPPFRSVGLLVGQSVTLLFWRFGAFFVSILKLNAPSLPQATWVAGYPALSKP